MHSVVMSFLSITSADIIMSGLLAVSEKLYNIFVAINLCLI